MKKFFNKIRSSFYDPAFYLHTLTQSLAQPIKLFIILGLMGIGLIAILLIPDSLSLAKSKLPQAIEDAYPDDLIVTINDEKMSVNKEQPFYIKNTLPFLSLGTSSPEYLVIFDGTDKLATDLTESSTFILVKEKYAITPGQNNQQQIISFSRIGTTTIEKSTIVGITNKVKPYFVPVVLGGGIILAILFTLFGTIFWVIFHMIYILIPALTIFLIKLLQKSSKFTFKESYITALYASIPVTILFYIFQTIFKITPIEYSYTILVVIFALINIIKLKK